MKKYEYIRLRFDGDLHELNALSSTGWKVITTSTIPFKHFEQYALLERELPEELNFYQTLVEKTENL